MLRTFPWLAVCVAVAILALFLQMDRQSRYDPAISSRVPVRFRSFAQIHLVAEALDRREADAFALARALVVKRPIPAEHLALLGLAAAGQGRPALAEQAIIVSAQRGWRVPMTQQAIALAAIEQGQSRAAADRLIALWRTDSDPRAITLVTAPVLEQREARTAFARSMAESPAVQAHFLEWGPANLDPALFADAVAQTVRVGGQVDCALLADAAQALMDRGLPAPAARLWQGPCNNRPGVSGFAFGPEPGLGPAGPFDWRFPGAAGLSLSWREGPDGWLIDYRHTEPLRAVMATRYSAFKPGDYELAVPSEEGEAAPGKRPDLRIWCIGTDGARSDLAAGQSPLGFSVPPAGCPVQFVRLQVGKGRAQGLRAVLR